MLTRLCTDHLGIARAYCYELELRETLRRRRTKRLATEVTQEQVTSWYFSRERIDEPGSRSSMRALARKGRWKERLSMLLGMFPVSDLKWPVREPEASL